MKTLGRTEDSKVYWQNLADDYIEALKNEYHTDRLGVIKTLIPNDLYAKGKKVFDFGCGDGVILPEFIRAGVSIKGADKSEEMLSAAKNRLQECGGDPDSLKLGGPECLKGIGTASLDGLLSLNVMCYFTDEEEKTFYEEASRIVKSGGYLIVTHSNELFDMFSLNKYTDEFFKNNFNVSVSKLLNHHNKPRDIVAYNVRENPITYKDKLKRFGFREINQTFSNRHLAPPSLIREKTYPSIDVPEDKKWTLMFTCSTYGSCSVRE